MTKKRPSVLPKKLNQLERQINKAFSNEQLDNLTLQLIHADIEQSLTFVKNLLSAEMASHPTKQNYLEHMWERVRELEAVYRGSGTTGSGTTVSTIDHVDNVGDDNDDDDDHASKCTCHAVGDDVSDDDLESTLGQDTGACVDLVEEELVDDGSVTVFDNVLFEEKVVDDDRVEDVEYVLCDDMSRYGASVEDGSELNEEKEIRAEMVDMKESEKQSEGLGFWKLCGALVSGILIGMFSMALLTMEDLGHDGYEGHGQFLTPT